MTSFSALLSALVEQKNIQIYPLTQYCSLDRSTMYKYLETENVCRQSRRWWTIADYMRLSPSEYED